MTQILIIGAGGHGQVVADALLSCARSGERLELLGFLDDAPALLHKELLGVRVLGKMGQLKSIPHDAVVVGIGNNATRAQVYERLSAQGEQFATVVHPRATLAQSATVGPGTVVFAGVVINTGAVIGPNVIINTGTTIDHHARIAAHVHLAPGVHLGGTVTLGQGVFLGVGANVTPNCIIGAWTTVGAGATVIRDLPERVVAVGVPARIIKIL